MIEIIVILVIFAINFRKKYWNVLGKMILNYPKGHYLMLISPYYLITINLYLKNYY